MDKIICVGKNYLEHAKEMGEAQPELPVLFLKPFSVLKQAQDWNSVLMAHFPNDEQVVPECELVLEIGKNGKNIREGQAPEFVRRISVGLDVTLRARQKKLKAQGHPWTTAKVFTDAALLGPWQEVGKLGNWQSIVFGLKSGDTVLQSANAQQMIYNPFFLIQYISQFFPICAGDIIFTGTPAGCTTISPGTKLEVFLAEKSFFVSYSR